MVQSAADLEPGHVPCGTLQKLDARIGPFPTRRHEHIVPPQGGLDLFQHGVFLLPRTEANRTAYARLVRRVEDYGGEASVLRMKSPDDAWQARILARFNAARDEEYAEVLEETERFQAEIDRERDQGKFTFAELEDEESNLERLRKYLGQVQARDAFGASGKAGAKAAVDRCAELLVAFAEDIYVRQSRAETGGDAPVGPIPDLLEGDTDALR